MGVLTGLHERNETLYYKIIMDNFEDMSKIIYTPTVGWACARFSSLYKKPRGMFFSLKDKGEFASMVFNWDSDKVDVVIDVGTDNKKLREDPDYMGLVHPRIDGWEYYELIDEFMEAVALRWPKALVQFEDFQTKHAIKLLQRYKNNCLMFNDDIQGTAATVLAGLYGAMKLQGKPLSDLAKQKIVLVGAGSAATGVAHTVRKAMAIRMGLTMEEASERFYILTRMVSFR